MAAGTLENVQLQDICIDILCDQNPASFGFYDKVPIVLQLRLKSPAQNLQRLLFKQDKSGDM